MKFKTMASKSAIFSIVYISTYCFMMSKSFSEDEYPYTDPWENGPGDLDILYENDRDYSEGIDYHEVHFTRVKESIELLKDKVAFEISLDFAKYLIDKLQLSPKANTKPYLVRAVYGTLPGVKH